MFQFVKNLFGGSDTSTHEPEVVNETSHPNPVYNQLPGNIFKQEFQKDKNAVMLDVRTAMEVKSGMLPKAQQIDIMSSNFNKTVAALDKSKTYYIYCRSGNRSGQACKTMNQMGFNVRNLMGGIGAWPK